MAEERIVIITGAGTGIGQATAARLAQRGWRVFATMRRPDPARHGPDALALDVTSGDSVGAAVAEVMRRCGRIDAIVNNAGTDLIGAVEETSVAEAETLFQTNFFGVHRLVREVLPIMRSQRAGRIVTVGSIAGFLPTPFEAFYCASKHALKGYTETLTTEIAQWGIKCILIEPGFIKTDLRAKMASTVERLDEYATRRKRVSGVFNKGFNSGVSPDQVATVIERGLEVPRPKLHQRVGRDAHILAFVRRFVPELVFQAGLKRQFG